MNLEIAAAARAFVLDITSFPSESVARLLGAGAQVKNVTRMREQGTILGHRVGRRGCLHPAFQIEDDRGRVNPAVADINHRLRRLLSPPEALLWWRDPAGGTCRPRWQCLDQRDVLRRDLEALLGGTSPGRTDRRMPVLHREAGPYAGSIQSLSAILRG